MERAALVHGRRVFFLDPWNEITLKRHGGLSTTELIKEAIIAMKRMAKRHDMVLMVAHHTAMRRDDRDPPGKYALADSAEWANKSDHLLVVHQPKDRPNVRDLIMARVREFGPMGKVGSVRVRMLWDTSLFDIQRITEADEQPSTEGGDAEQSQSLGLE